MDYMTLKETGELWGATSRRVNYCCLNGRTPGSVKMATIWLIPKDAEKLVDGRYKTPQAKDGKKNETDFFSGG